MLAVTPTHNLPQLLFSGFEAKQNLVCITEQDNCKIIRKKKKMTQTAEEQYIFQPLHSKTSYKCLQQMGEPPPSLTSLKLHFCNKKNQA